MVQGSASTMDSALSPARWPSGELGRYLALNADREQPRPLAEGSVGMVAGTTGAPAVHAGVEALKLGGGAADAAMVTALAQICLAAGSWVSYAGIMTMTYYEASTSKVHSMNAGYNTFREEKDPLSIPPMGTPSGRTAMVPGFMAGVQAAHDRFGRLPFARLFEPAIYFAENGFPVHPMLGNALKMRRDVLSRLPETRAIFTRPDGEIYQEGDMFRQPQLAETLRRVAEQGAAYMYTGEWAERFVDRVRREGGKATRQDLEDYRVIWGDPLQTTYRDYQVYTIGFPSFGGVNTIEALNLLEYADLPRYGHYTRSPEALYWFIQITRAFYYLSYAPPGLAKKHFPEIDLSLPSRVKKETARHLWAKLVETGWAPLAQEYLSYLEAAAKPNHSDAVVAIDRQGNMASIVHTINTVSWGTTGIFVDGISIPDSASFQQQLLQAVGPGVRLPDPTNPGLVLRQGRPVLAYSSIGGGLHEKTMQSLVNVLDFGMDVKSAVDAPSFMGPINLAVARDAYREYHKQTVGVGDFADDLLDAVRARGQEFMILSQEEQALQLGYWIGVQVDANNRLLGAISPRLNGLSEGY